MKSLFEELQNTKSEEDVKDVYIKHLNLKNINKNLIDIQTKEIWFEAKHKPTSIYEMLTQLIYYVRKAKEVGDYVPPFLCVIDNEKAGLIETNTIEDLLKDKSIKWDKAKSGSKVSFEQIEAVSKYLGVYTIIFYLENYEDEFKKAIKLAINEGRVLRREITPNNLKLVFDNWVDLIGKEIKDALQKDYALFFYADIMSDGTSPTHELDAQIILKNNTTAFALNNKIYDLASTEGYKKFWMIYNRPPALEHRNYLLERRDSLIPQDDRAFKGAFYTPLHVVDKAYEYLNNILGKNWQKNYIVWDMCCGVGNLEVKHSNYRNIYMSTLDEEDVSIMKASKSVIGATRFQYDYLNDDVKEDGSLDYTLSNKIPEGLKKAIAEANNAGGKKILVLINPPYAEATNADNTSKKQDAKNKTGVAKTKVAEHLMDGYGKSTNELFTQFVARIQKEIPNCTLAMFSKLKYVNAPNFEDFRAKFKAHYKGGFIVHSKAFDGLKGDFPIGFLIWDLALSKTIKSITTDVYSKTCINLGTKNFYNLPKSSYLNVWLKRPRANSQLVVPLSNAISVRTNRPRVVKWSDDALAHMCCAGNDLQNAGQLTFILSSAVGRGDAIYINPRNLLDASCIFTARKIVKGTWINDRDQFLQPNKGLSLDFKLDCLIYMLFNNSNLTASANGLEYNGAKYNLTNHFIPFSEAQVDANDRFESDFMSNFLSDKKLSKEAQQVLNVALEIYKLYYASSFNHKIREKYRLDRVDVGWYQIKKALEDQGDETYKKYMEQFKNLYQVLSDKLLEQVFEYGFLRQ